MKTPSIVGVVGGLLLAGTALAAAPEISVSHDAHPAMAEAQQAARTAWNKLRAAGNSNGPEADAHLQKAQDLLVQVNDEIRDAADAANNAKQKKKEEKQKKKQEDPFNQQR